MGQILEKINEIFYIIFEQNIILSLTELNNKIMAKTEWELNLFDIEVIVSVMFYISICYGVFYILILFPFKIFKRIGKGKK